MRGCSSEARPVADALQAWLIEQCTQVPSSSAIAKAIDYASKRWGPLTHYLTDAQAPLDNYWLENRIRPEALGRRN